MPHIVAAIDSAMAALAGTPYEIVVADGGSTDGTVNYLRTAGVSLLEGPDSSLYEGLNKALAAARGDYAVWLNSDDILCPDIVELASLARGSAADMATGEVQTVAGGKVIWKSTHHDVRFDFNSLLFGVPNINCRIVSMGLLRTAGPFVPGLGLGADREMMLRLLDLAGKRTALPKAVYCYQAHPASRTMGGTWKSYRSVHEANLKLVSYLRAARLDANREEVVEAYAASTRLALARAEFFTGDWGAATATIAAAIADHPMPGDWYRGLSLHRRYRGQASGW
ncbi:hypothetical protein MesoLjLb_56960 [Mesorhizobium sp. L-8-3]|nr:hypothetical protein MesoLjLb_56960 [Mesorhizobium sp. L-8-3]